MTSFLSQSLDSRGSFMSNVRYVGTRARNFFRRPVVANPLPVQSSQQQPMVVGAVPILDAPKQTKNDVLWLRSLSQNLEAAWSATSSVHSKLKPFTEETEQSLEKIGSELFTDQSIKSVFYELQRLRFLMFYLKSKQNLSASIYEAVRSNVAKFMSFALAKIQGHGLISDEEACLSLAIKKSVESLTQKIAEEKNFVFDDALDGQDQDEFKDAQDNEVVGAESDSNASVQPAKVLSDQDSPFQVPSLSHEAFENPASSKKNNVSISVIIRDSGKTCAQWDSESNQVTQQESFGTLPNLGQYFSNEKVLELMLSAVGQTIQNIMNDSLCIKAVKLILTTNQYIRPGQNYRTSFEEEATYGPGFVQIVMPLSYGKATPEHFKRFCSLTADYEKFAGFMKYFLFGVVRRCYTAKLDHLFKNWNATKGDATEGLLFAFRSYVAGLLAQEFLSGPTKVDKKILPYFEKSIKAATLLLDQGIAEQLQNEEYYSAWKRFEAIKDWYKEQYKDYAKKAYLNSVDSTMQDLCGRLGNAKEVLSALQKGCSEEVLGKEPCAMLNSFLKTKLELLDFVLAVDQNYMPEEVTVFNGNNGSLEAQESFKATTDLLDELISEIQSEQSLEGLNKLLLMHRSLYKDDFYGLYSGQPVLFLELEDALKAARLQCLVGLWKDAAVGQKTFSKEQLSLLHKVGFFTNLSLRYDQCHSKIIKNIESTKKFLPQEKWSDYQTVLKAVKSWKEKPSLGYFFLDGQLRDISHSMYGFFQDVINPFQEAKVRVDGLDQVVRAFYFGFLQDKLVFVNQFAKLVATDAKFIPAWKNDVDKNQRKHVEEVEDIQDEFEKISKQVEKDKTLEQQRRSQDKPLRGDNTGASVIQSVAGTNTVDEGQVQHLVPAIEITPPDESPALSQTEEIGLLPESRDNRIEVLPMVLGGDIPATILPVPNSEPTPMLPAPPSLDGDQPETVEQPLAFVANDKLSAQKQQDPKNVEEPVLAIPVTPEPQIEIPKINDIDSNQLFDDRTGGWGRSWVGGNTSEQEVDDRKNNLYEEISNATALVNKIIRIRDVIAEQRGDVSAIDELLASAKAKLDEMKPKEKMGGWAAVTQAKKARAIIEQKWNEAVNLKKQMDKISQQKPAVADNSDSSGAAITAKPVPTSTVNTESAVAAENKVALGQGQSMRPSTTIPAVVGSALQEHPC